MSELQSMGYVGCIDAQIFLMASFKAAMDALTEMREKGVYTGLSHDDTVEIRQQIEDIIGLEDYYVIEEETVEDTQWGKR